MYVLCSSLSVGHSMCYEVIRPVGISQPKQHKQMFIDVYSLHRCFAAIYLSWWRNGSDLDLGLRNCVKLFALSLQYSHISLGRTAVVHLKLSLPHCGQQALSESIGAKRF